MKCLLCNYRNPDNEVLKRHYISYHLINQNNYFFKELFSTDVQNIHPKRCDEFQIQFRSWRKKNYCFLVHREQTGGSFDRLALNVLKRRVITYYSLNYSQHKNCYEFFDETVRDFLATFERSFAPTEKVVVQGYMELVNYQPSKIIELESKRVWLTDVFTCKFFNKYVRGKMKNDFLKRIIVNGMTGSG